MKIIQKDEKLKKIEKAIIKRKITKEEERRIALSNFRISKAREYILEMIDEEISRSDVHKILVQKGKLGLDPKTLEEIGKLTVIETEVAERLKRFKSRL